MLLSKISKSFAIKNKNNLIFFSLEFHVVNSIFSVKVCLSNPSATICGVCNQNCINRGELKEHHVKIHAIHYKCPFDNCNFVIEAGRLALFKFARHIYYHNHTLPQLSCYHECIACDFKTPFIRSAEEHMKREGPFHDNQCLRWKKIEFGQFSVIGYLHCL